MKNTIIVFLLIFSTKLFAQTEKFYQINSVERKAKVDKKSKDGKRNLIVHNIGNGQVMEDMLFDYKIIGHYTYPK